MISFFFIGLFFKHSFIKTNEEKDDSILNIHVNGKIYRRYILKDRDSYNINNCKLSISFIFTLRKCYTIGPFVPPFTGERHGDSVRELL